MLHGTVHTKPLLAGMLLRAADTLVTLKVPYCLRLVNHLTTAREAGK
jgi:hypothetical protein